MSNQRRQMRGGWGRAVGRSGGRVAPMESGEGNFLICCGSSIHADANAHTYRKIDGSIHFKDFR